MPVPVFFFEKDIKYKPKNKAALREWIKNTVTAEGARIKEINYIFCSDDYLIEINRQYLNHDTFTDIITFNNADTKGIIEGDIFISVERVRENAQLYAVTEANELHRVMIHGVLHLLEYLDKKTTDKKIMTQKEDLYLSKRSF